MTQARATNRRTTLEKHSQDVIVMLVDGKTQYEVAQFYKVHFSSVMRFVDRHAGEIEALRAEVAERARDLLISNKFNRLAAKDLRWQLLEGVRQARAKGETGEDTGLVVRQFKMLGSGENAQMVEEWKIDDALLAALERVEHGAAEELDQLPRGPASKVEVSVGVLVRYVDGK